MLVLSLCSSPFPKPRLTYRVYSFDNDPLYKGLTCPDWDCCDSCVSRVDAIHPGHKLVSVATLDAIPRVCLPESYLKVSHPNILCDGMSIDVCLLR